MGDMKGEKGVRHERGILSTAGQILIIGLSSVSQTRNLLAEEFTNE